MTKVKRLTNSIMVCKVIHHPSTQWNEFGGKLKGTVNVIYVVSPKASKLFASIGE